MGVYGGGFGGFRCDVTTWNDEVASRKTAVTSIVLSMSLPGVGSSVDRRETFRPSTTSEYNYLFISSRCNCFSMTCIMSHFLKHYKNKQKGYVKDIDELRDKAADRTEWQRLVKKLGETTGEVDDSDESTTEAED